MQIKEYTRSILIKDCSALYTNVRRVLERGGELPEIFSGKSKASKLGEALYTSEWLFRSVIAGVCTDECGLKQTRSLY